MNKKNFIGGFLAVLFLAGTSYAQDAGTEHAHRAPSQAAIDACSGKSEGDACDYTNLKGDDKTGACANTSDGQTLFCKRSKQ